MCTENLEAILSKVDYSNITSKYPNLEGIHLYKRFLLHLYNIFHNDEGEVIVDGSDSIRYRIYSKLANLDCDFTLKPLLRTLWEDLGGDNDMLILDLCPILNKHNRLEEHNKAYTLQQLIRLRELHYPDVEVLSFDTLISKATLYRFEEHVNKNHVSAKLMLVFNYAIKLGVTKLLFTRSEIWE